MGHTRRIRIVRLPRIALVDLVFVFFFSEPAIRAIISTGLGYLGLNIVKDLAMLCIHACIAVMMLFCIIISKNSMRCDGIALLLITIIVFLISYFTNPTIGVWLADDRYGLLGKVFVMNGGVFAYLITRLQTSKERIFINLKICNIIWILALAYMTINRIRVGYWKTTSVTGILVHSAYHMSYGYYCAFISTLNYVLWKKEQKKAFLLPAGIFFFTSLIYGSRGVIIVYILFGMTQLWTLLKNIKLWKRIILAIFLMTIMTSLGMLYTQFIDFVQIIFGKINVESRTLNSLISGEFMELNGRERLWQIVIEMIKARFPLGYGAFGERPVVGQYYGWGYSHNIFMELIVSFGIFGLVVSCYLLVEAIKLINDTRIIEWNMLFALFFSSSGQLFISNSFWYLSYFWAAIAIGVNYKNELKKMVSCGSGEEVLP